MEKDRELFCLEKAEFERIRRRLEEEVLARDEQLGRLKSQKEIRQQEISEMKLALAAKNDEEMKVKRLQVDNISMQKELEGNQKEKEELKQEVEQVRYNNLPASDLEVKERRSW